MGIVFALVTVMAWGTWLAPSQNVPLRNQQVRTFHVAFANLLLAGLVSLFHGWESLTAAVFWLPFAGGVVWAVSGLCAFTATAHLGIAKAFGIWAPLNIVVSLICGRWFFGEFQHPTPVQRLLLGAAILVIVGGVVVIALSKSRADSAQSANGRRSGIFAALAAGVLWGVYFIPIKLSGVTMWVAAVPMAVGMFAGSAVLLAFTRQSPLLARPGEYGRLAATGLLWSIGNYGMLLLVRELGAGKGFTISQLSVVVNAVVGVYWLRDPAPGTRAARMTLAGCALAMIGGIVLGNLK